MCIGETASTLAKTPSNLEACVFSLLLQAVSSALRPTSMMNHIDVWDESSMDFHTVAVLRHDPECEREPDSVMDLRASIGTVRDWQNMMTPGCGLMEQPRMDRSQIENQLSNKMGAGGWE